MLRIPDKIHEELLNWARWCNLGALPHPLPRTECGSLEGNYRAPPEYDMDLAEPVQASRIRPNERNARKVQAAWESLEGYPRLSLKAEYPARIPAEGRFDRARRMRLTVQQYENNLQIAVNQVEAAFAVCP